VDDRGRDVFVGALEDGAELADLRDAGMTDHPGSRYGVDGDGRSLAGTCQGLGRLEGKVVTTY
jgi:hypothetical protein